MTKRAALLRLLLESPAVPPVALLTAARSVQLDPPAASAHCAHVARVPWVVALTFRNLATQVAAESPTSTTTEKFVALQKS